MTSDDLRARIRRLFFAEHWKIGTIAAELGVHRDTVACAKAQDEVDALLDAHQLTEAKGHLDQARSAHGRGEWAAANAQLRTFMEALLDRIAERIDPGEFQDRCRFA